MHEVHAVKIKFGEEEHQYIKASRIEEVIAEFKEKLKIEETYNKRPSVENVLIDMIDRLEGLIPK